MRLKPDQIDPHATILTVPGLSNSGPGHWQTIWEAELPHCHRVELGNWDAPHRNSWISNLGHAIGGIDGPVILAAHSLGCHAVAWWAAFELQEWSEKVIGALLVAPPEVDSGVADPRLRDFGPAPKALLPFPSIVVASRNDPYISMGRARLLAQFWGSQFADAGESGHINADSGLGDWAFGQFLLSRFTKGGDGASPVDLDFDQISSERERSAVATLLYGV
ncbi:alpha/beta hydrolase [Sphingobium sp. Sx8-8]|uniref:RBBP9/YdeN family alpha/beta hydrolase n=1 Tax=Sphingobium sp. Sx8-8 TaxID=2933617 RepID=UPI001F58F065|nr:alpha/beta hydrolase [Sphingobium sp. Sx8-8]